MYVKLLFSAEVRLRFGPGVDGFDAVWFPKNADFPYTDAATEDDETRVEVVEMLFGFLKYGEESSWAKSPREEFPWKESPWELIFMIVVNESLA